MMNYSEKLRKVMQELGLTQVQVVDMTGISKSGISQYLSGKHEPSADKKKHIAVSLGLDPDYLNKSEASVVRISNDKGIQKILPEDVARVMGMNHQTVRKGLQQGVFPWGYAIRTSERRWTYFINAKRFIEIEGIEV
jgi:transcriptional regulator with XRE-family HTH domain